MRERTLPSLQALEAKQAGEKKNKDAQKDIEQAGLYNSEVCAMLRCACSLPPRSRSPAAPRVVDAGG